MKTRLFAALLTIPILLTACSTAGTSSGTSQAPEVSSKVEVLSAAEVSSTATSSVEPVQYMSDEEYLSKVRRVQTYEYFQVDETGYYMDGDQYVMPIRPGGRKAAQTKTGMLFVYDKNLYLITKVGE